MRGFLAYSKTTGRRRFVDEIFVHPNARNDGVATSMLHAIARGPIELIVEANNYEAIALYTKLGMCHADQCSYVPKRGELCMKTTSFKRTCAKLQRVRLHPVIDVAWDDLTNAARQQMVGMLARHYGVSERASKRRLRSTDIEVRYIIVL